MPMTVSPLIYEHGNETQREILDTQYDVNPFSVNTIKLERIFVDKIFAAEFYYQREDYFDVAKHLYDLAVMSEQMPAIHDLLANPDSLTAMMAFKRREEKARIGSDLFDKPITAFTIFNSMLENRLLSDAFKSMENIYVLNEMDRMPFDNAVNSLLSIRDYLTNEKLGTGGTEGE